MLFIVPALGALIIALCGKEKGFLREGVSALGVILTLVFSMYLVHATLFAGNKTITYTAFYRNIFIDSFSSMMALIINVMLLLILLYSLSYMRSLVNSGEIKESSLRLYYSLVATFNATMMLTVISNNLIMLYISVEASTLATALLVCFFRDGRGLEAAYKYILLILVGIAFALMGCVLLYSSAVPHITGHDALLLTEIGKIAAVIPRNVAILAIACLIIGFGTKAGLVPFHAWLPDAHAEAPTPVSAILSGLIIKVGAYAFARTVTIISPHYHVVMVYVAAVACISMVLGIVLAFAQDDIKRLLAYSSISQMGYIFAGLGLGTYVGIYGGLFHLINHSIVKILLFLSAGALMYATGERRISGLGGLSRKMPVTTFCFFTGALGISGMPLFNGFHSKFAIFVGLAQQGLWWAVAISVGTGLLTLAVFVWAGCRIFWGRRTSDKRQDSLREVPFAMWAPMGVLAGFTLLIGVYPQILYPILDSATKSIIHVWKGVGF
ncbi:MAG: proton-conducting transporter membrane subunit [Pseudomonadota bacterium]